MILIINICKEKLHYFEFVKPIEDILIRSNIQFFIKHYKELEQSDLKKAGKIIICGTSLKDNGFIEDINRFRWIETIEKPILGICGGMQLICLIFRGKMKKETEIGFYKENFKKEFLGLKEEQEVYHLHNHYVTLPVEFEEFITQKIPQAIKHNTKEIYGALFHPEVRQKKLFEYFFNL